MKLSQSLVTSTLLFAGVGLMAAPGFTSAIEVAQVQVRPSTPTDSAQPGIAIPQTERPLEQYTHPTVWERGRTLRRATDWTEAKFNVGKEGIRLVLSVQGSVEVQSAQVQFDDGQVQSIDTQTQPYANGEFLLLDFGGKRRVQAVQIVGRTDTRKSAFSVQLLK